MLLENPSVGVRTYTLDKVDESLDSENYENWAYPLLQDLCFTIFAGAARASKEGGGRVDGAVEPQDKRYGWL